MWCGPKLSCCGFKPEKLPLVATTWEHGKCTNTRRKGWKMEIMWKCIFHSILYRSSVFLLHNHPLNHIISSFLLFNSNINGFKMLCCQGASSYIFSLSNCRKSLWICAQKTGRIEIVEKSMMARLLSVDVNAGTGFLDHPTIQPTGSFWQLGTGRQ